MAILFSGNKVFATPSTDLWVNQSNASLSFFLRIESRGSDLNTSGVIRHSLSALSVSLVGNNVSDPTKFRFRCTLFNNASAQASADQILAMNTAYHIAIVFTSGEQWAYVNGVPSRFGTMTGTTPNNPSIPFQIGSQNANAVEWTLDGLSVWNGYALTPENVADLRDGVADITTIGGTATKRAKYSLSGTLGAAVVPNAAGLLDSMPSPVHFSANASGAGTAVYVDSLAVLPTVEAIPYIATSGQSIGFRFARLSDSQLSMPLAEIFRPTVKINGSAPIALENPWLTGFHSRILYTLPAGTRVAPGDAVSWSAHSGWLAAADGVVEGATDDPVENRANLTVGDVESMTKTLRFGWNMTAVGTVNYNTWLVFANRAKILSQFSNVLDVDPLTKQPTLLSATTANANIIASTAGNNIDGTPAPFQQGYHALGWDDPDATLDFTLVSNTSNVLCTEVSGLANPGSGGVGKVKVYWIRYADLSTVTNYGPAIALRMTCASKSPRFDNLWLCSPGDFEWTADTPTVIDKSDPWRLSSDLLSKIPNTRGLRWMDSTLGYGGKTAQCEPEHRKLLTDFSWGNGFPKSNRRIGFVEARPWDQGTSPHIYTDQFGDPFPCTLADSIDDEETVLHITDAATAPVLVGLTLLAGTEKMRVMAVDLDTNLVTVQRGTAGTTAAAHAAGTIQVLNRYTIDPSTWGSDFEVMELVTEDPHEIRTFMSDTMSSNFPLMSWTNGVTIRLNNYAKSALVTGRNSYLIFFDKAVTGVTTWSNLSDTYELDPTLNYIDYIWPVNDGFPWAATAIATGKFPDAELCVSIPFGASDELIDVIADEVIPNFPAGRLIWLEWSNENWNWGFDQAHQCYYNSAIFNLGPHPRAFAVERTKHCYDRFYAKLAAVGREDELRVLYNSQQGDTTTMNRVYTQAQTIGLPIHTVAVAPYLIPRRSNVENVRHVALVNDDQALDMYVHDVLFDTSNGSYTQMTQAIVNGITAYSAASGVDCVLSAYEGGSDCALPPVSTTLTAAITDSQTTIPVASTFGFYPGQYVRIDVVKSNAEWVVVDSVPSSTSLVVVRGQGGTTASAHSKDANVQPNTVERNRDIRFSPLYYYAELDFYGFFQRLGFQRFNTFGLNLPASTSHPTSMWGAYNYMGHPAGYGDDRDGKGVNNVYVVSPGKSNTRPSINWNQEFNNVSLRGQVYLDWTAEAMEEGVSVTLIRTLVGDMQLTTIDVSTTGVPTGYTYAAPAIASPLTPVTLVVSTGSSTIIGAGPWAVGMQPGAVSATATTQVINTDVVVGALAGAGVLQSNTVLVRVAPLNGEMHNLYTGFQATRNPLQITTTVFIKRYD